MIEYIKAKEKDIPLLAQLDKWAFNRSYDNAFTEKEFKELVENKNVSLFLIEEEKNIIGFYIFEETNNEEGEIVGIAIIPTHQRKGFGKQILHKLLNDYSNKKKIKVVTHPKNNGALVLYLKNGFTVTSYNETYYGRNQPRIILYKEK
jgi:ribosomal protein S18 acetylase RimI-like enzyme